MIITTDNKRQAARSFLLNQPKIKIVPTISVDHWLICSLYIFGESVPKHTSFKPVYRSPQSLGRWARLCSEYSRRSPELLRVASITDVGTSQLTGTILSGYSLYL